ncbi:MAG: CoA transferase subunit A [Planctomycetes bacterium]|nr:CoA transferase subunit A [Planctomycetota bacterium]
MTAQDDGIPILQVGEGALIQPPDLEAFRAFNRAKTKALVDKLTDERDAIDRFVADGDYVGFELYGTVRCPMGLTRALIRAGRRRLRIAGQGVHEADLLLAAGMVTDIDFTYIGQEVYGVSDCVRRALESGAVGEVVEWSNAALSWRFKAAAMGVPFLPTRTLLGTDTLRRSAAKVIACPFTGIPLALLPALVLDVGFIHVHRADRFGNCQIDGISGFAVEMARASRRLLISAEEIVETDAIRRQPDRTLIPYYLVDAVVHHPFGSWPGEMGGRYERDTEHYRMFLEWQRTAEGAERYLADWVHAVPDHAALLEKVGPEHLAALRLDRPEGAAR